MAAFQTVEHQVDLCVVGGGLAGLSAAVAAARRGARVALMQDRPVMGGNASSEVRMWVCGAHGDNLRETGIIEELLLENQYRNPEKNYSIWDGILFGMIRFSVNVDLMLNCSCLDAEMHGNRIASVTGWQTTTQTYHRVRAKIFADCSGDSVLAPLTGARFRMGREGRAEYGEDIAPEAPDSHTMGMSCLLQARERETPIGFIAPNWCENFAADQLSHRQPNLKSAGENFWYLELGGMGNAIADTETLRDQLVPVAYGLWDYIKNGDGASEHTRNWSLDWVGMLPGKRESRRYVGDYVMTQHDVRAGGQFPDVVAYGGWSMDDHHPGGLRATEPPTIFHPAPSPYGIPYRCLYSADIENLMFAGRNISVTHTAMSSTRVMATCALLGQAVGTAAAIAVGHGEMPRGVYLRHLSSLQQALMEDDCYLPGFKREIPEIARGARLSAPCEGVETLRNGVDRPVGDEDNGCMVPLMGAIEYAFDAPTPIHSVRIVFDSDLNRATLPEPEARLNRPMICNRPLNWPDSHLPQTMVRAFRVEALGADGAWRALIEEQDNFRRLYRQRVDFTALKVRLVPLRTWGAERAHLLAFDVQ